MMRSQRFEGHQPVLASVPVLRLEAQGRAVCGGWGQGLIRGGHRRGRRGVVTDAIVRRELQIVAWKRKARGQTDGEKVVWIVARGQSYRDRSRDTSTHA